MSKQILLLFLSIGAFNNFVAQELPKITPPSPRAESFHIYGDIPVNHSTGVPEISIPLYTIESDGITVPIILRYHTGSIKPGNDNSNMAFGWTLDVGGRISRTVNSWPDEYVKRPATFKLTDDLDPVDDDDALYLYQASGNNGPYFDTKYDMFSYSVLGEHGNFIINNQEDGTGNTNMSIHELIESPKTISLNMALNTDFPAANNNESIDYFKIVNGIGQAYYYGENKNYEVVESGSQWGRSPSSWLLTRVVSADKSNTVDFAYETIPVFFNSSNSWADKVSLSPRDYKKHLENTFVSGEIDNCSLDDNIDNTISYEVKTIKEIAFSGGKVIFNLSTDKKRINSIEVRDNNNVLIKSISFTRSYFPNQTAFEALNQIDINDHNGSPIQTYRFEYFDYGTPYLTQTDFWGYFNGQNNFDYKRKVINYTNNNPLGNFPFTCQTASNEKNASLLHSKSYVLNKIIYPTGGSTAFDYELHEFIDLISYNPNVNGTITGGGLRVKSIVSKPEDGSSEIIKTYQYAPRSFGSHNSKSPFDPYNYTRTNYSVQNIPTPIGLGNTSGITAVRYRNRTFSHNFNSESLDTQINYEEVTEYQRTEISNSNLGKTVYTYEYGMENEYWNKYVVDPNSFDFGSDLFNQEGMGSNKLIYYYGASVGKLKSTEYFKNDGNGLYIPIKKTINTYLYRDVINSFSSLNVVLVCSYADIVVNGDPGNYYDQFLQRRDKIDLNIYTNSTNALPVLGSYDSFICQSSANLIKQEVKEIQEDGSELTTTKEYDYNENNLVTKHTVYDSNGSSQITKTLYPEDIKTISTLKDDSSIPGGSLTTTAFNAIVDMKDDLINQTAIPIQTETYKDLDDDGIAESNELLSLNRTSFKEWYTDIILPQEIQALKGAYNSSTNPLQSRIIFEDYYNNGNVKEVYKTDGTHIVYLWGYQQMHPIAKIENATYSQVSTAIVNLSNSSYNSISKIQAISNNDSTTDIDTFDITGNRIYVGEEGDLREVFDLLRLVLTDAQITNFTYDPLIGVTSTTDPRGETIYYEYDNFNRLKQVKDKDGNILSENQYNYKN